MSIPFTLCYQISPSYQTSVGYKVYFGPGFLEDFGLPSGGENNGRSHYASCTEQGGQEVGDYHCKGIHLHTLPTSTRSTTLHTKSTSIKQGGGGTLLIPATMFRETNPRLGTHGMAPENKLETAAVHASINPRHTHPHPHTHLGVTKVQIFLQ